MNIVLFEHPAYLNYVSIQRYTKMIAEEMTQRGHSVRVVSPNSSFVKIKSLSKIKKWLGYIDQYIIFPIKVRKELLNLPNNTLYIFTDHAQGPWVPIVSDKKHIIHCHDFLAQKSALGYIHENPTSWTGKKYQELIFKGYSKGKNFISVSKKTQEDLHEILEGKLFTSNVVYNSIADSFVSIDTMKARKKLDQILNLNIETGYILHIGGNQWYKNRLGVIEIYNSWREQYQIALPLLLVGQQPTGDILDAYLTSPCKDDIHLLSGINDHTLNLLYSGASVFVFPSLAEGFGWPIAEAMACGCPVITTDEAPMTEVAGDAAFFIARRPIDKEAAQQWANSSAYVLNQVIHLNEFQRAEVIEKGFSQITKFDQTENMNRIEQLYLEVSESI